MDPSCLESKVQTGVGVMVWVAFYQYTFDHLIPTELNLNVTTDHVHPSTTTMASSSDDYFQEVMHHVTRVKSSSTDSLNITLSSLYSNVKCHHCHQISIE